VDAEGDWTFNSFDQSWSKVTGEAQQFTMARQCGKRKRESKSFFDFGRVRKTDDQK
jgi:hypothetical protein